MSKALLLLAFAVLLLIVGPIATIWSLNTLFPVLNIPVTMDTWCAALILAGVFKTTISRTKD